MRTLTAAFTLVSALMLPASLGADEAPLQGRAAVQRDAAAYAPLVSSPEAKAFLAAARDLPAIEGRTFYFTKDRSRFYSADEAAELPESERAELESRTFEEHFYYHTRYGTPVAYARAIEFLYTEPGLEPRPASFPQARLLDYGCGGVGHLRMIASLGASATGVDVDPILRAYYTDPSDTGGVPLAREAAQHLGMTGNERIVGELRLVIGSWPGDDATREKVGGGYDVILSKNTLKNGYIHPERPVDKRMLVDLGVPEEQFLRAVYESLNPGGVLIIYNLSPAPSKPDEDYKPWSDGRSPWSPAQYEAAGFRVVAHDRDDSGGARAMGLALGWDQGERPMDLENDLFAHVTIVQRPAE